MSKTPYMGECQCGARYLVTDPTAPRLCEACRADEPDQRERHRLQAQAQKIVALTAELDRWKAEAERFTHLATQAETHRLEAERLRGEVARLTEKLFEVLTPRPDPVPVDPIHRALGVRGRPVIGLVTERV